MRESPGNESLEASGAVVAHISLGGEFSSGLLVIKFFSGVAISLLFSTLQPVRRRTSLLAVRPRGGRRIYVANCSITVILWNLGIPFRNTPSRKHTLHSHRNILRLFEIDSMLVEEAD